MPLPLKISVERLCFSPRGQSDSDFKPGDFILVYKDDFYGNLIHFGQLLRFKEKNKKFAKYTHAALIINQDGDIIEALGTGIVQSNIQKYSPLEYLHVGIQASDEDRTEMIGFAKSCLGEKYGWMTIFSIVCSLLSGTKFSFGYDGQEICSGLVARSLERSTAIFPRDASHIMPADLAKYYITLQEGLNNSSLENIPKDAVDMTA